MAEVKGDADEVSPATGIHSARLAGQVREKVA
jgi:hypothetical protein